MSARLGELSDWKTEAKARGIELTLPEIRELLFADLPPLTAIETFAAAADLHDLAVDLGLDVIVQVAEEEEIELALELLDPDSFLVENRLGDKGFDLERTFSLLEEVPAGKVVHVILDNYAAHKQPKVLAWLARHPRFTFHFTPTSCSWLNAVETFFATLTKRRLKRGVFRSVVDLQAAINRYLDEANHDPKPFTWTAHPDKIIAAVNRGRQALESIH